jgi:hypothetical protein
MPPELLQVLDSSLLDTTATLTYIVREAAKPASDIEDKPLEMIGASAACAVAAKIAGGEASATAVVEIAGEFTGMIVAAGNSCGSAWP